MRKQVSWVIPLVFLSLNLVADTGKRKTINKVIASVNDDIILQSDLTEFKNRIKAKGYQELFGALDPKKVKDDTAILDLLIEEKIINQQIKKNDIAATDMEVDGQIRAIQKRNGISQAQLSEQLSRLGTSIGLYKEGIRRQIERRNLIEREIKPTIEASDDQLKVFYQKHSKGGEKELQYKIAHILVESKSNKDKPLDRAETIYAEVKKAPQDFDKLAKEYSDDSSTSETGGVLGTFSPSSLAKEFKDVVPKLGAGNISKPVKTAAGYHIVKVIEVKAGDFNNLPKEKKEALRNEMLTEEVDNKMNLWLERKKGESIVKKF